MTIFLIIGLAFCLVVGVLVFVLIDRNEKIKDLGKSLNKLRRSFHELDEQAKLIVKTDLELNKTQEELDKRLNGLDALQKVSRLMSTTLDETEIFKRLDQAMLKELGFEKFFICVFNARDKLESRLCAGFSGEAANKICLMLENDASITGVLKKGELISALSSEEGIKKRVHQTFGVPLFVMAPLLAQDKLLGLIFAGNTSDAYALTEGDEELVSILSDQISQSVENARLFEEVYRSRQSLELKVSERTRQLSDLLSQVQQVSKLKSEFISAVSHELRTPLTSIKGYASILMTGKVGAIPDNVKERLQKINKHSDNLVKLINDLLDISRIESGKTEMRFTKHDVPSIIENVQDLLTPQMKDKNIRFEKRISENSPQIMIDVSQVERVFINLVGNAIKFTPEKGTIIVSAEHDSEKITCGVSDNGIGIGKEDAAKLFNEFYRVENEINANVKGTGLGLALAKKIVEAHGGRIWVESKVGEGTTFYFTIPLLRAN